MRGSGGKSGKARKNRSRKPINPPPIQAVPWLDVIVRFIVRKDGNDPTLPNELRASGTLTSDQVGTALVNQTGWPEPDDWRMCLKSISFYGPTSGSPVGLAVMRLGTGAANDPVTIKEAYGNPFRRAVARYKFDPQARVVQLTKAGKESILNWNNGLAGAGAGGVATLDVHCIFRPLQEIGFIRVPWLAWRSDESNPNATATVEDNPDSESESEGDDD